MLGSILSVAMARPGFVEWSAVARRTGDGRIHVIGVELPPARAHVLVRAEQIDRAGTGVETLRKPAFRVLDRFEAMRQARGSALRHDHDRLDRDRAVLEAIQRRCGAAVERA